MGQDGQSIRIALLHLEPSHDASDVIRCRRTTATLDSKPEYETISYVWGDAADGVYEILVNQQATTVTKNLHSVLRRLRRPDVERVVWADQLCIDQENIWEKSRHVAAMGQIYAQTSLCHLCWGELPDDVDADDARWLLALIEHCSTLDEPNPIVPPILLQHRDLEGPYRALLTVMGLAGSGDKTSWWMRIWTVQEAALSPRSRVWWGPLSCSWEHFRRAGQLFSSALKDYSRLLPQVRDFININSGYDWGESMRRTRRLANAAMNPRMDTRFFARWRHRTSADPRDKVFALLGLYSSPVLHMTKPDYSLSAREVFVNLTIDLIIHTQGLEPLAEDLRVYDVVKGLPRWALNLSGYPKYPTSMIRYDTYAKYATVQPQSLDADAFERRMTSEPYVLQIPGRRADTVAHVGVGLYRWDYPVETSEPEPTVQVLWSWYALGRRVLTYSLKYRRDFCRTVIGDRVPSNTAAKARRRQPTLKDLDAVYAFFSRDMATDGHVVDGADEEIRICVRQRTSNLAFFVTKLGMLGMGHRNTRVGDEVWLLDGGNVPFTLVPMMPCVEACSHLTCRRARVTTPGQDGLEEVDFHFGAKCYVHGLMEGQECPVDWSSVPRQMARMR